MVTARDSANVVSFEVGKTASIDRGWLHCLEVMTRLEPGVGKTASIDRGWLRTV